MTGSFRAMELEPGSGD